MFILCDMLGLFKNAYCGKIRSALHHEPRFPRERTSYSFGESRYFLAPFENLLIFIVINKECMFLMHFFFLFMSSTAMEQTLVRAKFHRNTRLFLLQRTGGKKINFHVAEINNANYT